MGWQPSYRIEARIYARYILKTQPDAKIAVLYQNDDASTCWLTISTMTDIRSEGLLGAAPIRGTLVRVKVS